MKKINANLSAVIHRFPHRKDLIKQLFLKSRAFQDICEDYRKCRDALLYLVQSDKDEGSASAKEYALLLNELEAEIGETIAEHLKSGAAGLAGKEE